MVPRFVDREEEKRLAEHFLHSPRFAVIDAIYGLHGGPGGMPMKRLHAWEMRKLHGV